MVASCFTRRVRITPVPKGFKLPHDQQKYDGSQEPQSWLADYLQAVQILGGTKETAMQKFATTPHRQSKVMVEQTRKGIHWKLGRPYKAIYKQLQVDIQMASINRRSQGVRTAMRRNTMGVHPTMEPHQKFGSRSFG
jgi:hypothetical protein